MHFTTSMTLEAVVSGSRAAAFQLSSVAQRQCQWPTGDLRQVCGHMLCLVTTLEAASQSVEVLVLLMLHSLGTT